MQALLGCAALVACIYGVVYTRRRAFTPLFFTIVAYGLASYFLGALYNVVVWGIMRTGALRALALLRYGEPVGLLGYAGAFLFLFSSYWGALDSLADRHDPSYRPRRFAALLAPVAVAALACVLGAARQPMVALALVPVAATSYFAAKHLLIPDVDDGIIRVMRPYNACMLALCLVQPAVQLLDAGVLYTGACIASAALVAAALPLAGKGVSSWFI